MASLLDAPARRFPVKLRWLLAVGPVAGVVSGTFAYLLQVWIDPDIAQRPIGQYRWVVLYNIVAWTSWFPAVWAAAWLAWRVPILAPFAGTRRIASIGLHVVAAIVLTSLHVLFAGVYQFLQFQATGQVAWADGQPLLLSAIVKRVFLFNFEWEFLLYWGVVAGVRAWTLHEAVQDREMASSRLRAQLAEAELDALQRQLQPHFVHNALHAVSALMYRDVDAADEMIERLGRFLRATMERGTQRLVTLDEELALVVDYLQIQEVRFGSDLRLDVRVPADLRGAQVPLLVLQPLVENAVKHGFVHRRGGVIRLTAWAESGHLHLAVDDDGHGLPADRSPQEGIGIGTTRERLMHLFDGDATVALGQSPLGGVRVGLRFPLRVVSAVGVTGAPRLVAGSHV